MITPDKKKIYGGPGILALLNTTRITPEEAELINKREKEPVSAPKVPYPLQPGEYHFFMDFKLSKLFILIGPIHRYFNQRLIK